MPSAVGLYTYVYIYIKIHCKRCQYFKLNVSFVIRVRYPMRNICVKASNLWFCHAIPHIHSKTKNRIYFFVFMIKWGLILRYHLPFKKRKKSSQNVSMTWKIWRLSFDMNTTHWIWLTVYLCYVHFPTFHNSLMRRPCVKGNTIWCLIPLSHIWSCDVYYLIEGLTVFTSPYKS